MSAGNVQQAGAAYEAVLVDKVTAKVDQIVQSINRIEAAFRGLSTPAKSVARSMDTVSQSVTNMRQQNMRAVDSLRTLQSTIVHVQMASSAMGQAIGQAMMHLGNQLRQAGLAATALATAMGGGFLHAAKSIGSYEEQLSRLRAIFGDSADENIEWAREFSDRIGRPITETINGLASFRGALSSLDLPTERIDEMSRTMQQLAIDFASVNELSDQEGLERMLQGLSGEMEAVRRFGINISAEAVNAYAESLGMVSGELTFQQKTMLRYNMIIQQMRDNLNAVGDAERTMGSLTNQFKRMRAEILNLSLTVGKILEPTFIRIVGIARELAVSFSNIGKSGVDQLVGVFTSLAIAGAGLIGLGTMLMMLGPPILAIGTIISSVLSSLAAIVPLAMMFPAAAGAIGAMTVAFGALAGAVTYFLVKSFPVQETLARMRDQAQELGRVFRLAIEAMYGAMRAQNWEDVWTALKITGEITFRRLGILLYETIRQALWNAGVAFYDWVNEKKQNVNDWIWGQVTGEWPEEGPPEENLGFLANQRKQVDELTKRLEALAAKYRETKEEAEKEPKKKRRLAEDMRPGETPGTMADPVLDDIRAWSSVGSFASNFASASSRFAPSINPMKEMQAIMEKQARDQEKNLRANEETNKILKAMDTLRF